MAERKIAKQVVYEGLGFPVILLNVPMVKVRRVWTPHIDHRALMKKVLLLIANSPFRLTGHQIRFVRQYFEMPLKQFGEKFDVSHAAVIKWENAGDNFPQIKWPVEKDIRLFILDELKSNARHFQKVYQNLNKKRKAKKKPVLEMDVDGDDANEACGSMR